MNMYELFEIDLQLFAKDEEDDNNPFSNFEDFVGDDEPEEELLDDADEQEQDEESDELAYEEEETLETEEPIKQHKKNVVKKADVATLEGKKTLSKQEYALVQEKRKNKDLLSMMQTLMQEVQGLKNSENERTVERKRSQYIQSYMESGYDEVSANTMADKDIKIDSITGEIGNLKKAIEDMQKGNQSTYETKTQAEQAILYRQAKAKQSKVDAIANTTTADKVSLTAEQKKDWEAFRKAPWGQGKSLKEFLKLHKETFG